MSKPWPKSVAGCERQIWAEINAYRREFSGGGAFGFDLPTFRLNSPERYERIKALQKMGRDFLRLAKEESRAFA